MPVGAAAIGVAPLLGVGDVELPLLVMLDWQPQDDAPQVDCTVGSGYGRSSGVKIELKKPSRDGD